MPKKHLLNFNQNAPDLQVLDLAGNPVWISSLWAKRTLLLAYTRHFGCTQCKEMLEELVQGKKAIGKAGMDIAVITQGTPEATALFAAKYAPGLKVFSDQERKAYQAYGLERGTLCQTVVNLKVLAAVSRSRMKGYAVEQPPEGQDAMQMSGTFIINTQGKIVLPFYYDNIADHPPLDLLLSGVLSTPWGQDFDGPVGTGSESS